MNRVHPHSFGLALGIFLAAFHAVWSLLVLSGIGQWLLDIIFKLHMLKPFIMVEPFSLTKAVLLVIVTGLIGYIAGSVMGVIWNRYAIK